jgi:membrane associated rhomboid family serine protease
MSITFIIIIVTALVSIQAFNNKTLFYRLDFNPFLIEERKEWYRFFSHALLHADWWHLILNMLVLFFFGGITQQYFEAYLGTKGILYFALLYVGGIGFATLPSYRKHKGNANYHSMGASGAVSAVLFSSVIFSPSTPLCLYGILCLPGIIWAVIYLIYSYIQGKRDKGFINHDAHLAGAIFGVLFTFISIPKSIFAFIDQIGKMLSFF